ncbi:MAG: ATP synthase F0 subunit C [Deltaproteobacteria bacterium]|jgi:F-type H+-transporting ATPase subunit c|nr:ATP synthase F0 subunit C [Deltaproteobacteria bacterium]
MKKLVLFGLTTVALLLVSGVAFADDNTVAALAVLGNASLTAGLAIGIGVFGPGIGQGLTMLGALSGMARNPDQIPALRLYMLLALAIIESLAIYALVISLIILFAFPYSELLEPFLSVSGAAPAN